MLRRSMRRWGWALHPRCCGRPFSAALIDHLSGKRSWSSTSSAPARCHDHMKARCRRGSGRWRAAEAAGGRSFGRVPRWPPRASLAPLRCVHASWRPPRVKPWLGRPTGATDWAHAERQLARASVLGRTRFFLKFFRRPAERMYCRFSHVKTNALQVWNQKTAHTTQTRYRGDARVRVAARAEVVESLDYVITTLPQLVREW